MIDPILIGRADALVRAGSPDPAVSTGDCPPCPPQVMPQAQSNAVVDIGGLSPTTSSQLATLHHESPQGRGLETGAAKPPLQPPDATAAPATSANRERRERVRSSTGPKTPADKARSSANAVTHGLRAKKIDNAVSPTLRAAYEQLRQQYLDEYKPTGAIESTLLDMVVFAAWQLYKIREMELFTDIDLGAPGSFGRSEKLARYRGSHERLLFRSLNQLKQIQQERALLTTDRTAALPTHIPPAVRLKPLLAHLKSLTRHPKTLSASAATPKSANRERREAGARPVFDSWLALPPGNPLRSPRHITPPRKPRSTLK